MSHARERIVLVRVCRRWLRWLMSERILACAVCICMYSTLCVTMHSGFKNNSKALLELHSAPIELSEKGNSAYVWLAVKIIYSLNISIYIIYHLYH